MLPYRKLKLKVAKMTKDLGDQVSFKSANKFIQWSVEGKILILKISSYSFEANLEVMINLIKQKPLCKLEKFIMR